jgi:hypothetical protein
MKKSLRPRKLVGGTGGYVPEAPGAFACTLSFALTIANGPAICQFPALVLAPSLVRRKKLALDSPPANVDVPRTRKDDARSAHSFGFGSTLIVHLVARAKMAPTAASSGAKIAPTNPADTGI